MHISALYLILPILLYGCPVQASSHPIHAHVSTRTLAPRAELSECDFDQRAIILATIDLIKVMSDLALEASREGNRNTGHVNQFRQRFQVYNRDVRRRVRNVFFAVSIQASYTQTPAPAGFPQVQVSCFDVMGLCVRNRNGYITDRNWVVIVCLCLI